MNNERPLADRVTDDFADAIDTEVIGRIGYGALRDYDWAGGDEEQDGSWPVTVVRDGREFEVDIDVRVVELTAEVKARRATEERIMAALLRELPS